MKVKYLVVAIAILSAPVYSEDFSLGRDALIPALNKGPWYYEIGGAQYVRMPQVDRTKIRAGAAIRWNGNLMCNNVNPDVSFDAFMNGAKDGWVNMQRNAVSAVQGTIASLPGLALQHADPGLYEMISTGFIQAQELFQIELANCRQITADLAQSKPNFDYIKVSGYERLQSYFNTNDSPNSNINDDMGAMVSNTEEDMGKDGIDWVCNEKAGGEGQESINASDIAKAAYNKLGDRSSCDESAYDTQSDHIPSYVHYWESPEELQEWFTEVLGDQKIYTDPNRQPLEIDSGTGLMFVVEKTQREVQETLQEIVSSTSPPTLQELRDVSFSGVLVDLDVINALKNEPAQDVWINRLALDIALEREMVRALEMRRLIIVGSDIEVVAGKEPTAQMADRYISRISREIAMVREEIEIRQSLLNSSTPNLLQREHSRKSASTSAFTELNTQLKGSE
jgi:integrating conjugative element protein (TIGR03755 family)